MPKFVRSEKYLAGRLAVLQYTKKASSHPTGSSRCAEIGSSFLRQDREHENGRLEHLDGWSSAPLRCPNLPPPETVAEILHLHQQFHFGPLKIAMYLQRHHDVPISRSAVSRILKQLDVNRMPISQRFKHHKRRYTL